MSDYDKTVKRAAERKAIEIAKRAKLYGLMTTEELREIKRHPMPSPWHREALGRVLRERGEEA